MIVTERKAPAQILRALERYNKIFLVGCGECSTVCKTGGAPEVLEMKTALEKNGKAVVGFCVPEAPCIAAKLKAELSRNMSSMRRADVVLVLACGLGVQSVKANDRLGLAVLPALDTVFGAVMDARGDFYEKCSLCAECVLDMTGGVCPVTLCAKGLLNGPCGGSDKGKCEVDRERDCAWVLIYQELERQNKLENIRAILPAKDHKKSARPHKLVLKG